MPASSKNPEKAPDLRLHQIREALRTLRLAHQEITEGYKFDDAIAGAKISVLGKAIDVLEQESSKFIDRLKSELP